MRCRREVDGRAYELETYENSPLVDIRTFRRQQPLGGGRLTPRIDETVTIPFDVLVHLVGEVGA